MRLLARASPQANSSSYKFGCAAADAAACAASALDELGKPDQYVECFVCCVVVCFDLCCVVLCCVIFFVCCVVVMYVDA